MAVADAAHGGTGRLDARQVLADAVGERSLTGARDIAAVIDARIRRRVGALVPLPAPPWSAQPTGIADPERRAYAEQIAALMDARKERIGEHAADSASPGRSAPWARSPTTPWPGWSGSGGPRRSAPTGNYPATTTPPTRSAPSPPPAPPTCAPPGMRPSPRSAPSTGPTCAACADGLLLHLRDTYPIETAWAPPWVGDELRQARAGARDAHLAALRATAEAAAARRQGENEQAARQQDTGRQLPGHARRLPASARPCSPRPWRTGPTGSGPPAGSGSWPWPPTPNYAAATPTSPGPRCAPPNPQSAAETETTTPPSPRATSRDGGSGSRTWPPGTVNSRTSWPTRQSLMIPAEDPDFEALGPAFPALHSPEKGPRSSGRRPESACPDRQPPDREADSGSRD